MSDLAFSAETHFAGAFEDKIDFFLLLVVPGHLAALGLEHDVADGEVLGLDGRAPPTTFCVRRRAG